MDEMETGKQKFVDVIKGVDAAVQAVIPVTPSNSMFLISLTKGPEPEVHHGIRGRYFRSPQ